MCGISLNRILGCVDEELELMFSPPAKPTKSDRHQSFKDQLDYLLGELNRAHVTRRLLWIEYKKKDPGGY